MLHDKPIESMNQEHAAIVYNHNKKLITIIIKIISNVLTAKMDWKQLEAMAEMEATAAGSKANGRRSESESVVR